MRALGASRTSVVPGGALAGGWTRNALWKTARAVPSLDLRFADNKSLGDAVGGGSLVTFTRASSGTFVGSDGLLKTATTNEARFDHNPTTGESLGLLVEEARTNLLLRSEEFDNNVIWGKIAASITANNAIAPNGASTADALIPNTTTSFHYCNQGFTLANGTTYTFSIYLKAAGYNFVLLNTSVGSASGNAGPIINLSDGTKAGFFTVDYPTLIQSVGNGWYRVSYQYTSSGTFGLIDINALSTSSISAYAGDGTSGIYVYGAQLEAGAFPTSYIPTTTATVTRAADVASITESNFSSWYNQTEGTVFAEYKVASSSGNLIGSSDGTNNNRIFLGIASGPLARLLITTSGSAVASIGVAYALNSAAKTAGVYSANYFQSATAGVLGTEDVLGGVPTVDRLSIGTNTTQSDFFANGTIKRLTFWPTRLSNTTIQQITQP